ncbi:MAG: 23S rRNA (pseudouridine(1915)-N(3))-methyltransferase RlmH, partial [Sodaliphilus sp.]|nr:23S rRNA (pseudouridine(1915)-N(3))-methyltransferase RlmH [Sodaliphilus sp.]
MKIELAVIGKTSIGYLKQGIDEYIKRLKHYVPFEIKYIDDIKNTKNISEDQQKRTEGAKILSLLDKSDFVVLLDEHGKEYTSMQYSSYIQKRMLSGAKKVVFVIGGPYGFSQEVYDRANDKISFSKMTFNHEMIRLIFTEQLYRAYT